eukprot:Rmarinus@m.15934
MPKNKPVSVIARFTRVPAGESTFMFFQRQEITCNFSEDHKQTFEFDDVVGPRASDIAAYGRCVKPYVQHVMHPQRPRSVVIVGCGAEGSGWSHMFGPSPSPVSDGQWVAASAGMLLTQQEVLKGNLCVWCSSYCIYGEKVFDLLCEESLEEITVCDSTPSIPCLTDLTAYRIESAEEARQLVQLATERRVDLCDPAPSTTAHHVFVLSVAKNPAAEQGGIEGDDCVPGPHVASLVFLQVASAEMADTTTAQPQDRMMFRKTNMGLLALGNVMSLIGDDRPVDALPLRMSRVTRSLRGFLLNPYHCVVIAYVNPSVPHRERSLRTLRFAIASQGIEKTLEGRRLSAAEVESLFKAELEKADTVVQYDSARARDNADFTADTSTDNMEDSYSDASSGNEELDERVMERIRVLKEKMRYNFGDEVDIPDVTIKDDAPVASSPIRSESTVARSDSAPPRGDDADPEETTDRRRIRSRSDDFTIERQNTGGKGSRDSGAPASLFSQSALTNAELEAAEMEAAMGVSHSPLRTNTAPCKISTVSTPTSESSVAETSKAASTTTTPPTPPSLPEVDSIHPSRSSDSATVSTAGKPPPSPKAPADFVPSWAVATPPASPNVRTTHPTRPPASSKSVVRLRLRGDSDVDPQEGKFEPVDVDVGETASNKAKENASMAKEATSGSSETDELRSRKPALAISTSDDEKETNKSSSHGVAGVDVFNPRSPQYKSQFETGAATALQLRDEDLLNDLLPQEAGATATRGLTSMRFNPPALKPGENKNSPAKKKIRFRFALGEGWHIVGVMQKSRPVKQFMGEINAGRIMRYRNHLKSLPTAVAFHRPLVPGVRFQFVISKLDKTNWTLAPGSEARAMPMIVAVRTTMRVQSAQYTLRAKSVDGRDIAAVGTITGNFLGTSYWVEAPVEYAYFKGDITQAEDFEASSRHSHVRADSGPLPATIVNMMSPGGSEPGTPKLMERTASNPTKCTCGSAQLLNVRFKTNEKEPKTTTGFFMDIEATKGAVESVDPQQKNQIELFLRNGFSNLAIVENDKPVFDAATKKFRIACNIFGGRPSTRNFVLRRVQTPSCDISRSESSTQLTPKTRTSTSSLSNLFRRGSTADDAASSASSENASGSEKKAEPRTSIDDDDDDKKDDAATIIPDDTDAAPDSGQKDVVIIEMAKLRTGVFLLEACYPLTIAQAFAMAVANLDTKLF